MNQYIAHYIRTLEEAERKYLKICAKSGNSQRILVSKISAHPVQVEILENVG